MVDKVYAHSLDGFPKEEWEELKEHGSLVAEMTAAHAAAFGFGRVGFIAGALHDIGKMAQLFQNYIRGSAPSGGDHSLAGARIVLEQLPKDWWPFLAPIIAGHHTGLQDVKTHVARMNGDKGKPLPGWERHVPELRSLDAWKAPFNLEQMPGPKGFGRAFLTRMLFSALVDADSLATEQFYAKARGVAVNRGKHSKISALNVCLKAHLAEIQAKAEAEPLPINDLRRHILDHALGKAALMPGLMTLTVPTGGGKTLTSLAFALEHAERYDLDRVIIVAPYQVVIEQTAAVCRKALAGPDGAENIADVLEHHVAFEWEKVGEAKPKGEKDGPAEDSDSRDVADKLRRAAENWDVPVVVTTAVQFFESLFANRRSPCRKLHNIAKSVVILDEVQTLPLKLLLPTLAALDELARHYNTTIILCTATQPALQKSAEFPGGLDLLPERELAPDPVSIYRALKRVEVEVRTDKVSDDEIVARFAEQPQMLCVVNTRAHARRLFDRIAGLDGKVHLTTLMCPRHRRQVLEEVRRKLEVGEPVRLVATSLIEAGVDISFPEAWRAATGADSAMQTAGRVNRSGKMDGLGRLVVFEPKDGNLLPDTAERWAVLKSIHEHEGDIGSPDAIRLYFHELFWGKGQDYLDGAKVPGRPGVGILPALRECCDRDSHHFASISAAYRMIDDPYNEPVVVPWDQNAVALLERIGRMDRPRRADLRLLQPYIVQIPMRARSDWVALGELVPVHWTLGQAVLRFQSDTHYKENTGVDIFRTTYREPLDNQFQGA